MGEKKFNCLVVRRGRWGVDRALLVTVAAQCGDVVIDDANKLLKAVQRAVDKWIRRTKEGLCLYAYAGSDLNIGDLAGYANDTQLQGFLLEEGVADFTIEEPESTHEWHYDCPLTSIDGVVVDGVLKEDEDE